MKVIFHLDLDSYFASAATTVMPHLKGMPIAITTGQKRSIIAAASYEAKDRGVKVPMPFYKAKRICPDLIPVMPDYDLYTSLSTKIFEFLLTYTKNVEIASIDEAYMDVTDIWKKEGSPVKLAKKIQKNIMDKFKLPISIGISDNKFSAKMSTSINKPLGITVTPPGKTLDVMGEWDIITFNGIGQPTKEILNKIGIFKIKDLAAADPSIINEVLGKRGSQLISKANGNGTDELELSHNELKGIGNSKTFLREDLSERYAILEAMKEMVYKVSHRAQIRNMVGKVVSVAIKSAKGKENKVKRKQITLYRPINSMKDIMKSAITLFDQIWDENPIKFIGVHLGQLNDIFEATYQMGIFDEEIEISKIEQIVNDVNRKMKKKVVVTGKEGRMSIKRRQHQTKFIESDKVIKHYDEEMKKRK